MHGKNVRTDKIKLQMVFLDSTSIQISEKHNMVRLSVEQRGIAMDWSTLVFTKQRLVAKFIFFRKFF
jgi:hypothetical protein